MSPAPLLVHFPGLDLGEHHGNILGSVPGDVLDVAREHQSRLVLHVVSARAHDRHSAKKEVRAVTNPLSEQWLRISSESSTRQHNWVFIGHLLAMASVVFDFRLLLYLQFEEKETQSVSRVRIRRYPEMGKKKEKKEMGIFSIF